MFAHHPAVTLLTRVLLSVALVAAATALLNAAHADLTFASISLLLVLVGASALGYIAGLVAAARRPR